MALRDAQNLALEQELDLVMITSGANPPVCKIISWSKFKYEYSKKQRGTKQHSSQLKEMWFKPLTDVGDLDHKTKKIREFLVEKHKVKLLVKPSRSTYRLDRRIYFDLLNRIIAGLTEDADVEIAPKLEGKNVYAIIKPKK
jgi:translation initiation factor IF-3